MLSFYTFSEAARIAFNTLVLLSAGLAALGFVMQRRRFNRGLAYWLNCAAAFLVLGQTYIHAALMGQVYQNVSEGFIVPSEYVSARYVLFAVLAIVALLLSRAEKSLLPILAAGAAFLTLPVMETWSGRAFPLFFSASLFALLAGGASLSLKLSREYGTSISGLSIRQAMDSLDTALLFCQKDGRVLMQNTKMQDLMLETAGRVYYDGKAYLETIVIPRSEDAGHGSYLYRLPDSAWLFTAGEIKAGRKTVTQIAAADVTGQNKAAAVLKDRQNELEARQRRLEAFIENIEELCRVEELLRVKKEIHDAQNQKLIRLLQYLRYGELPDDISLESLKTGIHYGAYAQDDPAADPPAMLAILERQYGDIGVKIELSGELPAERDTALVLAQILQEAAANAVAHGHANEIYARVTKDDGKYVMGVTDNGAQPAADVKEGSGLAGMRRDAEKLGGRLDVSVSPRFTLSVTVPARSEGKV